MNRKRLLFIAFIVVLSSCASKMNYIKASKKISDFHLRGGLPKSVAKLQHGDTLNIAYLGGSITAQDGWRVYSQKYLSKEFPQAHINEINAAIGGTGSDFGVFRLNSHVLQFKPDLPKFQNFVTRYKAPTPSSSPHARCPSGMIQCRNCMQAV